ncbi:hypothetical protein DRJ17_00010 [Candidatus Woesearchaeota archaeon]|nr:MAG: hypothetical protein DRJ17_00010 [Candidatus Woesearchaeota archaeon]
MYTDPRKKAITVQLSWIYILIAGAMILIFFSRVIVYVQGYGEKTITDNIRDQLNDAFVKIRADRLFFQQLQTPKDFKLERCDFGKMYYKIGRSSLKTQGIYSPSYLKPSQEQLLLWTLPWEMPYWIDNMLYLTSPEVLYVFIEDQWGYVKELLEDPTYGLPANISRVVISHEDFSRFVSTKQKNVFKEIIQKIDSFYKVKFVMVDAATDFGEGQDLQLTFPEEVMRKTDTAINILPDEGYGGLDGAGEIQFFDVVGAEFTPGKTRPYLGRSLVFAAIFAQDAQQYECNLQYFMQRFKDVNQFTQKRAEMLYESYPPEHECHYYIEKFIESQLLQKQCIEIQDAIDNLSNADTFKELYEMSRQIEDENYNLVRYRYCAGIY